MARVTLTVLVFLALFALVESLNTTKLRTLSSLGGPPLALAGVLLSALRSSIGALPVTVLIGTIAGVLDLQARRELTIIQATGRSIWTVLRAPLVVCFILALLISTAGDTALILGDRLSLDLAARAYFDGKVASPETGSTDRVLRGDAAVTYRVHGPHALTLKYLTSRRRFSFPNVLETQQRYDSVGLYYSYQPAQGMGAVKW